MAGRKVFTSGEILTAADVNSFLMDQSVMVFADSTARGSAIPSPSEGMTTYLSDVDQVQFYDGSQFRPVGSVLQVLSTTKVDTFSTTSATFVDITGLSVSITPTSSSSKIYVTADVQTSHTETNRNYSFVIARGGTAVTEGTTGTFENAMANNRNWDINQVETIAMSYLDSPASTSALTYNVRMNRGGAGTAYINRRANDTQYNLVSTITVMEIAG